MRLFQVPLISGMKNLSPNGPEEYPDLSVCLNGPATVMANCMSTANRDLEFVVTASRNRQQ